MEGMVRMEVRVGRGEEEGGFVGKKNVIIGVIVKY